MDQLGTKLLIENAKEEIMDGADISNVEFSNNRISMNIYKELRALLKS